MTPNRPDATCLMALRRQSPFSSGANRRGSSPPSPEFERPPKRFIAMASVSCASAEMEPKLIAPVEKRFTISLAGSTSSSGTGGRTPVLNFSRPRSEAIRSLWSSTSWVYSLNTEYWPVRVECCSLKTVSGLNRWYSPSRRHWYSPPTSSSRCAHSSGRSRKARL
ncbi:Uncharacterised protein [Mycobacteroides abscessus subsp. abscessus]|nr:Uncharacterised protein [Mycobacteroides abscessus subsp. abscessus]